MKEYVPIYNTHTEEHTPCCINQALLIMNIVHKASKLENTSSHFPLCILKHKYIGKLTMNALPIRLSIQPSKLSPNTILTSFFPLFSLFTEHSTMCIWLAAIGWWSLRLGDRKKDELIIIICQYVFNPIYFAHGIHSHYIETYFTDFQFVPLGNLFLIIP